MKRGLLLAAAALVALAGCKDEDSSAGSRKVTVSSTDDATKPITDDDYRFRLAWPGKGWKLLGERDVRKLAPDAVAGMSRGGEVFGAIIVEEAPGLELEAFARLVVETMQLEDKSVEALEEVEYAGVPALRFAVTGKLRELPMRYAGRIFLHQGYGYQVLAWGGADAVEEDDLAPVFSAFSLREGTVTGRAAAHEVVDSHGIDWRVEDGVFASAAHGLVVRPRKGWQVVVGGALTQMNSEAEVGLVSAAPEAYMLLLLERVPGIDPETYAAERLEALVAELGTTVVRGQLTADVLGAPRSFTRLTLQGQPPLEYLHGVVVHDDLAIQVTSWYMRALRDRAEPAIEAALQSIDFLPEEERRALARQLSEMDDPQNVVGADFSLRGGVYRDFARALRWERPEGLWTVQVGQSVRALNPAAQLYTENKRLGVHALLISEDAAGYSAATYHDAALANLSPALGFAPHRRAEATRLGDGAPALLTDGLAEGARVRQYYRVTTAVHGDRAVQVHVWGAESAVTGEAEAIDAVARGLRFDPALTAITEEGGVYLDRRLGFSMKAPQGWKRAPGDVPAGMRAIGTAASWQHEGGAIEVLALAFLDAGQDEDWFMGYAEQSFRDRFGERMRGEPERSEAEVAGRTARHLAWTGKGGRLDLYLLRRDRTVYALIAQDRDGKGGTARRAVSGFSLIR